MNRFVFPVSTLPTPIQALATEFENAFDSLIGSTERNEDFDSTKSSVSYSPQLNLVEYDDRFELSIDLPGVNPDAVAIEMKENRLKISGERPQTKLPESSKAWRWESGFGNFQRVIQLPDTVNSEAIVADYAAGVLNVSVPKLPKPQPKKIAIRVGGGTVNSPASS